MYEYLLEQEFNATVNAASHMVKNINWQNVVIFTAALGTTIGLARWSSHKNDSIQGKTLG